MGIRLTGGAGAGAIFMLLAHLLTPRTGPRVLSIPDELRGRAWIRIDTLRSTVEANLVRNRWVILDFREIQKEGRIIFLSLSPESDTIPLPSCFVARRIGDWRPCANAPDRREP